jgi:hypothetical protein
MTGQATLAARATLAMIGAATLLAACQGSPSSADSGSPAARASRTTASAVGYSACMRAHGVPNYPDPDSSGQLPKTDAQQLGVSTSRYHVGQLACRHLLPTAGGLPQQEHECMQNSDCPPALVQQMLTADRKLALCMRSHGVPNFPDPTADSDGPVFDISAAGISDAESHTHRFGATLDECERRIGGNAPYQFG